MECKDKSPLSTFRQNQIPLRLAEPPPAFDSRRRSVPTHPSHRKPLLFPTILSVTILRLSFFQTPYSYFDMAVAGFSSSNQGFNSSEVISLS
ncbi:hypothetical protein F8388_026351 [Cannabis sativa]|uniref:Uncharacterized protein n=1 Tax=Cannabis sativa TaxID=3483 RepID=A0A7J6E576_CANSA|nr:hypothetical protein F8388_026351 [Cannabis sativa]